MIEQPRTKPKSESAGIFQPLSLMSRCPVVLPPITE
jgi:hypothetical protein